MPNNQTVARVSVGLTGHQVADLLRFHGTTEDGQDYDVAKAGMKELACIGVIRWCGGSRYEFTDIGMQLCALLCAPGELEVPPSNAHEDLKFTFQHPHSKECRTVTLKKAEVADEMEGSLHEKLREQFCQCEAVGETNVVDCNCSDYTDDFEFLHQNTEQPSPPQGELVAFLLLGDVFHGTNGPEVDDWDIQYDHKACDRLARSRPGEQVALYAVLPAHTCAGLAGREDLTSCFGSNVYPSTDKWPLWANWVGLDQHGSWVFYENKPITSATCRLPGKGSWGDSIFGEPQKCWAEMLYERPKVQPEELIQIPAVELHGTDQ